eukprot:6213173-Pleurochrysis_carterae.AAC.5
MVVDEHEKILEASVMRADEWAITSPSDESRFCSNRHSHSRADCVECASHPMRSVVADICATDAAALVSF